MATPVATSAKESTQARFQKLKKDGIDLVLGRSYQDGISTLSSANKLIADDEKVLSHLFLAHLKLEKKPSTTSECYKWATRLVKLYPSGRWSTRAKDYMMKAKAAVEAEKKGINYRDPGDPNASRWVYRPDKNYKLTEKTPLMPANTPRLGRKTRESLWKMERGRYFGDKIILSSGTSVKILDSQYYSFVTLLYDDGKSRSEKRDDVDAVYAKVVSGRHKGKSGWLINHLETPQVKGGKRAVVRNRLRLKSF